MASAKLNAHVGHRIQAGRRTHPAMTTAHAAAYLGISEEQYCSMEAGRIRPTKDQIMLLADLMNVLPGWFFEGLKH